MDFICPCRNAFTAYSPVRTEPLARHLTLEKKIASLAGALTRIFFSEIWLEGNFWKALLETCFRRRPSKFGAQLRELLPKMALGETFFGAAVSESGLTGNSSEEHLWAVNWRSICSYIVRVLPKKCACCSSSEQRCKAPENCCVRLLQPFLILGSILGSHRGGIFEEELWAIFWWAWKPILTAEQKKLGIILEANSDLFGRKNGTSCWVFWLWKRHTSFAELCASLTHPPELSNLIILIVIILSNTQSDFAFFDFEMYFLNIWFYFEIPINKLM